MQLGTGEFPDKPVFTVVIRKSDIRTLLGNRSGMLSIFSIEVTGHKQTSA